MCTHVNIYAYCNEMRHLTSAKSHNENVLRYNMFRNILNCLKNKVLLCNFILIVSLFILLTSK